MTTYQNNFHSLRLFAAWLILFHHSFALYYNNIDPFYSVLRFMDGGTLGLAIFFTISGYLVTASWMRQKSLARYCLHRGLRIFPALAAVILLAAFVLGPLMTTLTAGEYFAHPDTWKYLRGMAAFGLRYNLPGVFETLPYPGAVNGSLWSLKVELHMYMLLAALGLLALLRPKLVIPLALAAIVLHLYVTTEFPQRPKHLWGFKYSNLVHYGRLGFYFWAGSACWLLKDRIRFTWKYALIAGFLGLVGWYALPPYGAILTHLAAPYIILTLALATPPVRWRFLRENDLSYGVYLYAFPIQQACLELWGKGLGLGGFMLAATVLTLMAAAFSWFAIERRMLALKSMKLPAFRARAQQNP